MNVSRANEILDEVPTRNMVRGTFTAVAVSGRSVRLAVEDWWINEVQNTAGERMLAALRAEAPQVEQIKFIAISALPPQPPPAPPPPRPAPPQQAAATRPRCSLPVLFAGEFAIPRAIPFLVDGVLPENSLSVVFGLPKTGKTFFVVDLALHIATGRTWRGRAVARSAVVYLALEGGSGIQNRLAAWMRTHGAAPDDVALAVVPAALDLLRADGDGGKVVETVHAVAHHYGLAVKLIVIDTLARALAGGDENGSDMAALIREIDLLRSATGAAVLVVHHPKKDGFGGERGHSSLRGAVDVRVEVTRTDANSSSARILEGRDVPGGAEFGFTLRPVELGASVSGLPFTSCVALPADGAEAETADAGEAQRAKARAMKQDGASVREIATAMGATKSTVHRWTGG